MEPVVSSPVLIARVPPYVPRFSEGGNDEYREEHAEITVEHPLPMDLFDLLDDGHGTRSPATPLIPRPSSLSCWDRLWDRWYCCWCCCC